MEKTSVSPTHRYFLIVVRTTAPPSPEYFLLSVRIGSPKKSSMAFCRLGKGVSWGRLGKKSDSSEVFGVSISHAGKRSFSKSAKDAEGFFLKHSRMKRTASS